MSPVLRTQTFGTRNKPYVHGAIMVVVLALVGMLLSACGDDGPTTGTTDEDELKCISANATRLASIAKKVDGRRSRGYCYRHVKAHLRNAGFSTATLEAKGYGASAYKFAVFAKSHPDALSRMGLKKVNIGLDDLPKGAIIVWPRGMCGYNRSHGHIEVVVDDKSSRACSDFCGRIKKGCGTPDIFIPKSCSTTRADESDGDDDDSAKAPPLEDDAIGDGDDAAKVPEDDPEDEEKATDDAGGCWSPTLGEQVDPYVCVQSRKDRIWFQCKDGKWYRGVEGNNGPFRACVSTHPL